MASGFERTHGDLLLGTFTLERRGVGFERNQNCFLSIDDLPLAPRLSPISADA